MFTIIIKNSSDGIVLIVGINRTLSSISIDILVILGISRNESDTGQVGMCYGDMSLIQVKSECLKRVKPVSLSTVTG